MTPVTGVGVPAAGPLQSAADATGGVPAFVGATALVLTGFLVLARLSQRVVDVSDDPDPDGNPPTAPPVEDGASTAATPGRERPVEDAGSTDGEGGIAPPADGAPGHAPPGRGIPDGATVDPDPNPDPAVESPAGRERGQVGSLSPAALLANVALTQGLFGGILAAAAWFFRVPGTALGLSGGRVEGVAAVGVGLAFGVALWVGNEVAGALADAAGAAYDEGLRRALAPTDARGWAVLLGGVLPVIALVEEFLFRAAAVGAASSLAGGAWALAVVSSLAFALGHGAQGRAGVVVTGALGFVLAAGFLLSGSLLVVVIAHYVVNALEFLVHEWLALPDPVWSSREAT